MSDDVSERVRSAERASASERNSIAVPEPVRDAWQRVVDGWGDPTTHDALVGLVAQHNCYAWAAARYKSRAGDTIAEAQLARLRKAATAQLFATATKRSDKSQQPYRATLTIFAVLIVVLALGLVYAWLIHDTHPAPATPITPKGR